MGCARWRSQSVASGDCCPLAFCCWGTLLPRSVRCRPSSSPVPLLPKNKQPSASVILPCFPSCSPPSQHPPSDGRVGRAGARKRRALGIKWENVKSWLCHLRAEGPWQVPSSLCFFICEREPRAPSSQGDCETIVLI